MERKIGDVIEYDGQKFQIMEGRCKKCYFKDFSAEYCEKLFYIHGSCVSIGRSDYTNICYKLIEE